MDLKLKTRVFAATYQAYQYPEHAGHPNNVDHILELKTYRL